MSEVIEKDENKVPKEDVIDLAKVESSIEVIQDFSEKLHLKNQKRIKNGIYCIIIIPLIFLFLLLFMENSKIVYLLLWVISLFLISTYLITVAYLDYEMNEKLNNLGIKIKTEESSLIGSDVDILLKELAKKHGIDN